MDDVQPLDLIRVPSYKTGYDTSLRVEYRAPDPACNPYLAFSALLAAGLKGIEEEYPLPSPVTSGRVADAGGRTAGPGHHPAAGQPGRGHRPGGKQRPAAETLGDFVHDTLIRNKKKEWADYSEAVN